MSFNYKFAMKYKHIVKVYSTIPVKVTTSKLTYKIINIKKVQNLPKCPQIKNIFYLQL